MVRTLALVLSALVADGAVTPRPLSAQVTAEASAAPAALPIDSLVVRTVARARRLVETGEGEAARSLLDSLVGAQEGGSDALAEALHWRAALGENAREAERDWKRLVVEVPLSARAPVAFLRLAELELLRGHPDVARMHLERMLRDHPADAGRVKALLWIARSYVDEGDAPRACAAIGMPELAALPEGESALQAQELRNRCAAMTAAATTATATTDTAATTVAANDRAGDATNDRPAGSAPAATSTRGRWAVQVGAFPTRAEADRAVRRLKGRGVDARVDGTRKPYRVRVGRYATRTDATAALARLKKQGHTGFVTETAR